MSLSTLAWKLASPYDAYVSHVGKLESALERVRSLSERALGYEAGLHASLRLVPGAVDGVARRERLREQLGSAAAEMSDEEFEEFLVQLGGGSVAEVESNRAQAVSRLSHTARGLEEYLTLAARELAILERRGYNPSRPDVARQLRDNHLPATTIAEYRRELRDLGALVAQKIS